MMDLKPKHVRIVKDILSQYVPEATVYAFGSRVRLTAKRHSDLDLVIMGKEAIPIQQMNLLEEAFADSDLPFRVDVMDWHLISDNFREHIANCRELVIEAKREGS